MSTGVDTGVGAPGHLLAYLPPARKHTTKAVRIKDLLILLEDRANAATDLLARAFRMPLLGLIMLYSPIIYALIRDQTVISAQPRGL
jgi:hypothetical protein